jgi:ATP-dependent RNA helicase DeaD
VLFSGLTKKAIMKQFNQFPINAALISILEKLGFTEPTEIQEKSLPLLLEPGKKDFHGQAHTGTGKTLAFGIPLLHHIDLSNRNTQALIVAPTRELAVQIHQSLQPLAEQLGISMAPVYGGVSIEGQHRDLKRGLQIVVGTPGRLNDHLRRKSLKLDTIRPIVLDEADIMLDMGFKEEIDEILNYAPKNREIWLFSATIKQGISTLKKTHMTDPISVSMSKTNITNNSTEQFFCMIPAQQRFEALCRFISTIEDFYGFIFCQTKIQTSELAEKLALKGYSANALHGDMNQANRNRVIQDFKNKNFQILVATDVAARGIDISDITHVINYQLPDDQESYIHRIGRTGRAGKTGIAITFIMPREQYGLRALTKRFNIPIKPIEVPSVEHIIAQQIKKALSYLETLTHKASSAKYAQILTEHIKNLPVDSQVTALANLLNEKFFAHINTQPIIVKQESHERSHDRRQSSDDQRFSELFINLGMKDGITTQDVVKNLTNNNLIARNHIAKVRIIKNRSFVLIPAQKAHDITQDLEHHTFNGRRWRFV